MDEERLYFREPFLKCLDDPCFRATFVYLLIIESRFEKALEYALPLIGTGEDEWYMLAKAWYEMAFGEIDDALELYDKAKELVSITNWSDIGTSILFDDLGRPKLTFPFLGPLAPPPDRRPAFPTSSFARGLNINFRSLDSLALLRYHRQHRLETEILAGEMAVWIERMLHLDFYQARKALRSICLAKAGPDEAVSYLYSLFCSDVYLEMAGEVFGRLSYDWGFESALGEVACYLNYLLGNYRQAEAERLLASKTGSNSLICANLKALVLSERGLWHKANELWGQLLDKYPDRSVTFMVLGRQALSYGKKGVAARYFLEACCLEDYQGLAYKSLRLCL